MQPDWMNQLIIPLGADLFLFLVKALIVAFVASWLLNKYAKPFFPKRKVEEQKVEEQSANS
ncbi:hypothetical protein [Kroppenstedtia sanguinis]|uniref:Uncharacterized protein n=1 Tax=Kroppenstedtia sanguinis TaxID=1380684 RepID=A0ABW4C9D3_9BACL